LHAAWQLACSRRAYDLDDTWEPGTKQDKNEHIAQAIGELGPVVPACTPANGKVSASGNGSVWRCGRATVSGDRVQEALTRQQRKLTLVCVAHCLPLGDQSSATSACRCSHASPAPGTCGPPVRRVLQVLLLKLVEARAKQCLQA
jgi:hypothetical protein